VRGLDNWEKAALSAALGTPWNPSGGSKKAKDILGMRNRKNIKVGGGAPPRTQATAHTYSPHYTNADLVGLIDQRERPHHNSSSGAFAIGDTNSLMGERFLAASLYDSLRARPRSAGRVSSTPITTETEFPHPPMPGPCTVAPGIRTRDSSGNPIACPVGYRADDPTDPYSNPIRFYPHDSEPFVTSPPPEVVSGGSRKNKSRSPSRNMARKSSRRATRRSSTRKGSRKGSRKTRRSRR
jgi:hypothetical protein